MSAGSEYAIPEIKGISLNDVKVGLITDPNPDVLRAVRQALFPDASDDSDSRLDDYLKLFIANQFVIGATTEADNNLLGVFGISDDSYNPNAVVISYSRIENSPKTKGAMTAAGLKVTETLLRKFGITNRSERKKLRELSDWGKFKSQIEAALAIHPIRAYVDVNNIPSINMLERMGYRRVTEITEQDRKKYQYDLDIDSFDDAIDNFGNPMRNLQ